MYNGKIMLYFSYILEKLILILSFRKAYKNGNYTQKSR
jgi:hypothetical protein